LLPPSTLKRGVLPVVAVNSATTQPTRESMLQSTWYAPTWPASALALTQQQQQQQVRCVQQQQQQQAQQVRSPSPWTVYCSWVRLQHSQRCSPGTMQAVGCTAPMLAVY
jgi:hypothetical protein